MKRIGVMLLMLALLCGCSKNEQALTLAPTSIEQQEPTHSPYEKQVLEGGVWVQTDYSKYAPDELIEAKYTRLSEEYIPALQPSDDYGIIYPFIGNRNDSSYMEMNYYGMMDASGRVVVDAVYNYVEPVYTAESWESRADQVYPMWMLRKQEMTDSGYPEMRYALATWDGSFVSEHIYSMVTAYEEYIFAYIFYDEKATVVHVYDAEGNLCLNSEELPFYERLSIYVNISYGNGLFTVRFDEPSEYYIADWEGNLLYGPYEYASGYVDGYAVVRKNNGSYAYLDVNGNYWKNMEFTNAENFSGGYAVASDDDKGKLYLLSAKDGIIMSVDADDGHWNGIYFSTWKQSESGWENCAYDTEGKLLNEWTEEDSYEFIGTQNLLHNYDEGKLINLKTGEEYLLGDVDDYYVSSFEYRYSFAEVPYYSVYYYDDQGRTVLMDESFRETLSTTGYIEIEEDVFTGKRYIMLDDGRTQIFDINAEPIITLQYADCQVYNNIVLCYDDIASYYYDLEGNLIFCYPYNGLAGD